MAYIGKERVVVMCTIAENRVAELLKLFDEVRIPETPTAVGPSMTDSIHTRLLARQLQSLPEEEAERTEQLRTFLAENPRVASWAGEMLSTPLSRRNLKALLRIELRTE